MLHSDRGDAKLRQESSRMSFRVTLTYTEDIVDCVVSLSNIVLMHDMTPDEERVWLIEY